MNFSLKEIEDQWIQEKKSSELSEISPEFYENVAEYLAKLTREQQGSQGLRRELIRKEIDSVIQITQEIHFLRLLKVAEPVIKGDFPSSLLESERRALEEVKRNLGKLYDNMVAPAVAEKKKQILSREATNELVLITSEIPQFVGEDMRRYGPFKPGEAANLPKRSAEILRRRGLAEKLRTREVS